MLRSLQAGVFFTFLAVYLLAGSREALWGDPKAAYKVAERWVIDDKLDIGYAWPVGTPPAPDGKHYSPYAALPSIVQLPAAKLHKEVLDDRPEWLPLTMPLLGHLASAVAGALTCLLFFRLCRQRLGVLTGVAGVTTLILGLATMMFPYARDPFSEMLQALCFTGLVGALVAVAHAPPWRHALALGTWAGLLLDTKSVFALALPGAALFLIVLLRKDLRRLAVTAGLAAAAFAPWVALLFYYNTLRWGGFADPALTSNSPLFTQHLLWGLWGFLFSSGKSIFLYSPPLIVALFGLPLLWRRHRLVAVALLCTALPVVAAYAKHVMWNGDQAWGPRYLVFMHPVLLLPLALLLQAGLRRRALVAVALVVLAGAAVQVAGSAIWRGHWIRIARTVNDSWLGKPNASGSVLQPCMACFEHHYGTIWLPALSPIEGHVWMLRHMAAGDDFAEAKLDAPWRQYTTLDFDVGALYDGARLDWWGLLWLEDHPRTHGLGLVILCGELALLLAGGGLWWRGSHRQL